MQALTSGLADALVEACPKFAYFDQVAVSCDCTWGLVRSWLVQGITSGKEPHRSFAKRFYAADSALGARVHQMVTTGSLEIELTGIDPSTLPEHLSSLIDSHLGPVLAEILIKAKPIQTDAGVFGPKATIRLKPADRKMLAEWSSKRWPATEHVGSILPLLESKPVKRIAAVESFADLMRGRGSSEMLQAFNDAKALVDLEQAKELTNGKH